MRALVHLLALALLTLTGACGERAVDDSPCALVCVELRDNLINNFGVAPDQIDCLDGSWGKPQTCDDCKRLLHDRYGVQAVGDDICRHF